MFCCYSSIAKSVRNAQEECLDISIHNPNDYNTSNSFGDDSYLTTVTYEDTVPYVHTIHKGKVVKVYDGDTITIASKLLYFADSPIYRFPVRLRGIDSPEMRTKSPIEKELAQKAQQALYELIFGKIVYLTDIGMDKYGRVLANVYLEQVNMSQWMLDNGHAVQYNGGTKNIPDEWKKI